MIIITFVSTSQSSFVEVGVGSRVMAQPTGGQSYQPYHTIPYHMQPYKPYHTKYNHTKPYHTIYTIHAYMQSYKPCHAVPNIIIPNHTITFHTIPYTSIPTWTSKTEGLCTSTVLRKDKLVTGKRYNQTKAKQCKATMAR